MSSRATGSSSSAFFLLAIVGLAVLLLISGLVMGIAMASHMGGGMMGRAGSAPQTPFVSDGDVTVDMRGFEYFPRDLTINAGATVTWKNRDNVPHTATEDDKGWDTGVIARDDEASLTFNSSGHFTYYCTVHPSMKGRLTVR